MTAMPSRPRPPTFAAATLALLAALACTGCHDSPDGDADADADTETDADADADADAEANADAEADADADEGEATIELGFHVAVSGEGSIRVGAAELVHGVGVVEIGAPLRALAYETLDWTESTYTLYFVLAPTADDLNVLYLYCGSAAADSLDYVWHESFSAAMDYEPGSGTCLGEARDVTAAPRLARLEAEPGPQELLQGVTVVGPAISLDGAGGSIALGGEAMAAWPFELVDCSEVCTADPQDGWWELHMLLNRPSDGDRCYGIVYLFADRRPTVVFQYGFCLESLERMAAEQLEATWSIDEAKAGPRLHAPAGPWDERLGHVVRPGPMLR